MEAEREHFVYGCTDPGNECPGCVANGISEKVANEIYDEMSSFASYAFNKSHAACYAYVAFRRPTSSAIIPVSSWRLC